MAATGVYIGPDGGNWNTPSNWLGGIIPVNGDAAYINPSGPGKTVIFDGNYTAPGLTFLTIDEPGFGTSAITQAGNNMIVGQEQIGYGGRGRYVQTGGANSAQSLFLGGLPGTTGTYQLDGGTLTTSSFLYVGSSGSGSFTQTGGTLNVSGFGLTMAANSGGNGTYYLSNGNVNANLINIGAVGGGYGSIQQTGGGVTVSNTVNNNPQCSYNLSGGALTGNLNNSGNFAIAGGLFSGGGTNNSYFSLSTGSFNNTAGFTNNGILSLVGGTFANTASFTNYGQLQFNGNVAITNTIPFTNESQIIQNSGNVDFSGAGGFINNGNMQLAPGWSMNFFNTNPINNGTINLNGGRIGGSTFLVNRAGATITGSGLIFSMANQGGRILLTSGTFRTLSSLNNSGIIELADNAASLSGGPLNNSGQVVGHGSIGNELNNSGIVEANGGNLVLGGLVTPNIGTFGCPQGGKITVINGMSTNAGLISLTGGTFENNSFAINNTGQISGFGTFRSGGLTNNGSITFTGGFTTINGNVTNAATRQIKVAHNPALFTGTVINNGNFKNTATTITFSGTYTENGTYTSDPADNYFNNVNIGPAGAWVGGVGDRFFVSGDFLNQSTNSTQWDTVAAELHLLAGAGDVLAVNGKDLGITFDGYDDNFAWGMLSLVPGRSLTLIDADSTSGGAIYVNHLDLQGGIDQIADISGNGMTLNYNLGNPDNAYLGGKAYQLAGGGSISPVPEPGGLLPIIMAAPLLAARRRKSCRVCFSTPRRRV